MGERELTLQDCLTDRIEPDQFIGSLESNRAHHREIQLETVKGERWFRVELRRVSNESGEPEILASFFDITEQRMEHFELRRLANTDVLTQVSNRHGIIQRGEKLTAGR